MKKHLSYLILVLLFLVFGTGCHEKDMGTPAASTVADFSYEISNEGYAPCEVTFTNKSLNAAGYLWDFGNGETSTEANPVINYATPGLYHVSLTCTPVNSVYYNKLVKTTIVIAKDPNAGLTQVFYFTTRGTPGNGHLVILDDNPPVVQDFTPADMTRPYGIAVDTTHNKVYITDYYNQAIYKCDADGKNPQKILDATVPGQEMVGDAEAIFVLGDKIYWGRTGGIYRANLDGTSPEVFINTGGNPPEYPIDMQYDPVGNKIYLVNDKTDYSGGYWSVNMDGSDLTELIPGIDGTAIEVDFSNGKTYMALYAAAGTVAPENGIYVCNIDGSGVVKIGDYGSKATWGVTIDYTRNKLIWGYKMSNSDPDGKIIRANMDGTDPEDWITGVSPHAMTVAWVKL